MKTIAISDSAYDYLKQFTNEKKPYDPAKISFRDVIDIMIFEEKYKIKTKDAK